MPRPSEGLLDSGSELTVRDPGDPKYHRNPPVSLRDLWKWNDRQTLVFILSHSALGLWDHYVVIFPVLTLGNTYTQ